MHKLVRLLAIVTIALCASVSDSSAATFDGATCSSGGPGSTGCSIGGLGFECSVTCAAGYHACCNATGLDGGQSGCRCVQILAQ